MEPKQEDQQIPRLVSLTKAAAELKRNRHWIKGVCETLGIELRPAGKALVMSEAGFNRLKKHDERLRAKTAGAA